MADQVWFMDHGRLIETGTPNEFFSSPRSERAQKFLSTEVDTDCVHALCLCSTRVTGLPPMIIDSTSSSVRSPVR